jgi:hypothetical protein
MPPASNPLLSTSRLSRPGSATKIAALIVLGEPGRWAGRTSPDRKLVLGRPLSGRSPANAVAVAIRAEVCINFPTFTHLAVAV